MKKVIYITMILSIFIIILGGGIALADTRNVDTPKVNKTISDENTTTTKPIKSNGIDNHTDLDDNIESCD